ncbi:uncharacterized protein LOC144283410 isoform X2 [Canis aureus]
MTKTLGKRAGQGQWKCEDARGGVGGGHSGALGGAGRGESLRAGPRPHTGSSGNSGWDRRRRKHSPEPSEWSRGRAGGCLPPTITSDKGGHIPVAKGVNSSKSAGNKSPPVSCTQGPLCRVGRKRATWPHRTHQGFHGRDGAWMSSQPPAGSIERRGLLTGRTDGEEAVLTLSRGAAGWAQARALRKPAATGAKDVVGWAQRPPALHATRWRNLSPGVFKPRSSTGHKMPTPGPLGSQGAGPTPRSPPFPRGGQSGVGGLLHTCGVAGVMGVVAATGLGGFQPPGGSQWGPVQGRWNKPDCLGGPVPGAPPCSPCPCGHPAASTPQS